MWLLLGCSILALMVLFERLFYFHRSSINVSEFLQGLANLIRKRNFSEALHECAGTPGPVARVIHTAIINHNEPLQELRHIVQEAGQLEVPKLERKLRILSTISIAAPLIGFLGTVTGMIEIFSQLTAQSGYTSATDLSEGFYTCLLTTAGGIVVAITAYVAYNYLSAWVQTYLHEMERAGIEVIHLLHEVRNLSEKEISNTSPSV